MRKQRVIPFFLALTALAASFPEYPVKPARDYPAAIEKSGLVVAAIPVEDVGDQGRYFGMNLHSKGYIPVLLVIENSTTKESFLLNRKNIVFSSAARSAGAPANPADPSRGQKAVEVIGSAPTIYTFLVTIEASKSKSLRQHLLTTELQNTTLSPGTSVHGFIFIPDRREVSSQQKILLTIPFQRSGSGEGLTIEATL